LCHIVNEKTQAAGEWTKTHHFPLVVRVGHIVISVRQSLATARAFHLSAYDAVYLDLARRNRLPLATLDERLRLAAGQAGVELVR
jgi:predicted nucleic acid-binding protein